MQKRKQMSMKRERQNLKQDLSPCKPFHPRQAFNPYKRDQLQYPDTLVFIVLNQTQGLKKRSITYCEGTSQENIPGISSGRLEDLFELTVGHCFPLMGTLIWDLTGETQSFLPKHRDGWMTSTKTSQHWTLSIKKKMSADTVARNSCGLIKMEKLIKRQRGKSENHNLLQ